MDELISKRAAIEICEIAISLWDGQLGTGVLMSVKKNIQNLPPAQPDGSCQAINIGTPVRSAKRIFTEIIRCKNCNYACHDEDCKTWWCEIYKCETVPFGFCHLGEKKEG